MVQGRPSRVTTKKPLENLQSDSAVTTESSSIPDGTLWLDFRLPRYIRPLHYDLLLHPDLVRDNFTGSANITVNVTQATKYFLVHAFKMEVGSAKVYDVHRDEGLLVKRFFLYEPHEYLVVEMESEARPGVYSLHFDFEGPLTGSIVGFYKSWYTNSQNETKYVATSKFEPTYARRAFPCFDEPSFKSTFSVSLVHPPRYIALSNMPVQVIEPYKEGLVVTKFMKSVPMVTYLACFIVCDFQYKNTTLSNGKPFRVYSAPDQINKTDFALEFGSRVLEYLESYFDVEYPLPKQDMVAIPDFASGAMEHWGVVTFRETRLLHDDAQASVAHRKSVAHVIAHEMVHMWFGNLMTLEWWDDLWLNEGFASYVEYKGVDQQHPEWDVMSRFAVDEVQSVMERDATLSSHPIVQPVAHPDEITEIFDFISYGKGASVLRMLEFFVGPDKFRLGISQFLKKYQFKNARTADLWETLTEACGYQGNRSIGSIMKNWTERTGFPVVTVKRSERSSSTFTAKQQRFVTNSALYHQMHNDSKDYFWSIPLSYISEGGKSDIIWIHNDEEVEFTLPINSSEWVKFNVNQTGYYLVNYEKSEWERLKQVLITDHKLLSPSDRSHLLFDAFLLAEAGRTPWDTFLSTSEYLRNETHAIPWETAHSALLHLARQLQHTEAHILVKSYIKDLTADLYKKVGLSPTSDAMLNRHFLRTNIIWLACMSGNQACLDDVAQLFQNWTQGQEIPASLRSVVYRFGMAEIGREEHWNYMWERYMNEPSPIQRPLLMRGLAHVRIPSLILRYLEYATDETKIRSQDFFIVLKNIAENPIGRPFVWNFIREKWPYLVERFTLNDRYLGVAVKTICSYFTSEEELREMRKFFSKYPEAGAGKRKREQALETVQNNIKWLHSHKDIVKKWLEDEGVDPWLNYRLPRYIVPEHYDLLLYPQLNGSTFSGSVNITIRVERPTENVLVHAKNLNISKNEIWSEEDEPLVLENVFQNEQNDYLVLVSADELPEGKYRLYFEFEGPFKLSLSGLYKSSYVDPDTKERRYVATTQFEPNHARDAFPCFDEPYFRSTFNVSIVHVAGTRALSNTMALETTNFTNDLLLTTFDKSLPMVTYLLAVVVSDFAYKETLTENGVLIRLHAASHLINKTYYALNASSNVLTYFEDYFGIPFPLKKLDMVAMPDFGGGGMENWGLIIYSQGRMVCDNSTTVDVKFKISSIISHELAHMWFGDLVTMEWWSDLWLNEGFATYTALKGVKRVEPEIFEFDDEGLRELTNAMQKDQSINSNSIVRNIFHIDPSLFNTIIYQKGCSVLRMLEKFMGKDFRTGVTSYLKRYSYRNAETADLWDELSLVSNQGLNVSAIMNTWTKQKNYPYLQINHSGNNTHDYFAIKQNRFLLNQETKLFETYRSPYNYAWQIPITYRTSESDEVIFMLLNTTETVNLIVPKSQWTKFNVNFTGYYSVNYDTEDWKMISRILLENRLVFSPTDRVNFVFDALNLASAGYLDYGIALNLTRYLQKETYNMAWSVAMAQFMKMDAMLKDAGDGGGKETRELLKEYIRSLTKDLYKSFSWNTTDTDFSLRVLRKKIIDAACRSGNHDCLVVTAHLFKQWMKGKTLDPESRRSVLQYGLRSAYDEESWLHVWQQYQQEQDPDYKDDLLYALTTTRNTSLLERLMHFAENDSLIRKHDYFYVLRNIAENPRAQKLVFMLITNDWKTLISTHGDFRTESFAKSVFSTYTSEADLQKVREFYRNQARSVVGTRERTLAIENIANNIAWLKRHRGPVKSWLQKSVFMPWWTVRLPDHIVPRSYDITLHPNVTLQSFEGHENVEIEVLRPTLYVLVHALALKVTAPQVKTIEDVDVAIEEAFPYQKNEFFVIRFKEEVPAGTYVLALNFSGKFSSDGHGMSRHQYKHRETGEISYLIATQFEPTHARRVFPCFDEPSMKAKFKLRVVHETRHSVVSNMPVERTTKQNDAASIATTSFQESVQMSTYLLCCVVSDFAFLETHYKGKSVRAYAPPDRLREAEHGLNLTVRLLEKLEEYFDVPYVLPKLDSVIIPDHTVPGMEHWGAIVYSARRFLDPGNLTEQQRVVDVDRVIAHELVHQWFGNLVTMKWWNDIWLSEGISTLLMYIPLKKYHPSVEEVHVRKMSRVMCSDSSVDSRPILSDASSRNEIVNMFDTISYEKAGAVMKMLQHILQDDFRKGLSNFLKKHAYNNAETKDLWTELSSATTVNVNISDMMDTWTRQMGFPYVELQRDGSSLHATQRWFLRRLDDSAALQLAANVSSFAQPGFVWRIPLVYKNLATGNEHTLWLNDKNTTFEINALEDDVIKFNPGFLGFYIVKYDSEDWFRLGQTLLENHEDLSVPDRFNLLHDAFLLAETGRLSYEVPLQLSRYLRAETSALPWNVFRDHYFLMIRRLDAVSETTTLLQSYVRDLTMDLYDQYLNSGNLSLFKKTDQNIGSCSYKYKDLDFITIIMDLACRTGNSKCMDILKSELDLLARSKNITVDMQLVLDVAIPKFGTPSLWKTFHEAFLSNVTTKDMKYRLAYGLARFSTENEILSTIETMMSEQDVEVDLARYLYQRLNYNPSALPLLWNLTKYHYEELHDKLDFKNSVNIGLSGFCDKFKTQEYLSEYKEFVSQIPKGRSQLTKECSQDIQGAIDWLANHEESLRSWLSWNVKE